MSKEKTLQQRFKELVAESKYDSFLLAMAYERLVGAVEPITKMGIEEVETAIYGDKPQAPNTVRMLSPELWKNTAQKIYDIMEG